MTTSGAIVLFGAVLVCAVAAGAFGVLRQRGTVVARRVGWVCLAVAVLAGAVPLLALYLRLFVLSMT
jgi:uncharacterized membrane protein